MNSTAVVFLLCKRRGHISASVLLRLHFGYFQCRSLFLMWKLQQVLPNNDLFFSQHRITPKLIKVAKNIYFRQMDALTRIVTWL